VQALLWVPLWPAVCNQSNLLLLLGCIYCLQFVLPTDSPHLAKSAFAMALSPMLWAQHKPDRFDSWSAGIVLLQVSSQASAFASCMSPAGAQQLPRSSSSTAGA
jgi:hypothetical protein